MPGYTPQQYVDTDAVRLAFAHLVEPVAKPGKKPQYEACLLIPKESKGQIERIKAAYEAAAAEGKAKFGMTSYKAKPFEKALRDGDDKDEESLEKMPFFKDHWCLNAHSQYKPRLQGRDGHDILEPTEVYSGMYARCKLVAVPFKTSDNSNKGVTWYLQVVQKIRDGEPLGGGDAESASFPPLEEDYDPNA